MTSAGWIELGRLVKQERSRRNLTQVELARSLGFKSRTIIGDLERAVRTNYDDDTKRALEYGLGWQPGSFDRVIQGGRLRREVDPIMAELRLHWRRLDVTRQTAVLNLARDLAGH